MRRPLKPFVTEYKGSGRRSSSAGLDLPEPDHDRPARPDPMQDPSDNYDAAMRAADALFSRPPASADPDAAQARGLDKGADKNGGRILRALEEPPHPEMAALEARYAEKRRGRKPGSKNKPKAPIEAAAAPAGKRGRPRKVPVAVATMPAIATSATLPNAAPLALAQAKPRNAQKRGAWQGGRAKLGEAWKRRRLPPACW